MEYLGIPYIIKNKPPLDGAFIPFEAWSRAYLEKADHPLHIALEREAGKVSVFSTRLRGTALTQADLRYAERLIKFLLWSVGAKRVYLCGNDRLAQELAGYYASGGARAFDAAMMQEVYEQEPEFIACSEAVFPAANEAPIRVGGHTRGCRIGFDAGGSDRKVSAVINGETVYTEEVVWHPKTAADPQYHYDGIVAAFRAAASRMPRVDGIGVSSAGILVGGRPAVSSLFRQVPRARRDEVRSIYERAAREFGAVPLTVANDGDVTALAGSMILGGGCLMGLAMGTSEAAGYVNENGDILGWLNELAFAPVDLCESAARDEWSGDSGVGSSYFSQDAVVRLAPAAGIILAQEISPAEQLKTVQTMAENGHRGAQDVFRTIGVYLGHTLPLYARFYALRRLLVLGRVASGVGGELIVSECRRVLAEEYPDVSVQVTLPDESFRRVGQSVAAAGLPEITQ